MASWNSTKRRITSPPKSCYHESMPTPAPTEILTTPDYPTIENNFAQELTRAAQGETTSLPFIKHVLGQKPLIHAGVVQGIVIGGTHYIVSTEEIIPGENRIILHRKTGMLPTFAEAETFFTFLTEHLDPRATAIGVNFGFPLAPTYGPHGELDGRLIKGTKEHSFVGIVGQTIGNIIREVVGRKIPVTVANDTVCLTLAGTGDEAGSLIAGTGFNIGIKLPEEKQTVIVNLEAGNFNKFEPSEVLKTIDEASDMPGMQLFEKVISGKYLAEYFTMRAKKLRLSVPHLVTSQELSALSQRKKDTDAVILARALLERSACLVATALAGVYEFHGKQQLTIIAEGSLLWKGWQYFETIHKELLILGLPKDSIILKHIPESSIKGALGLLTTEKHS